MNPKEKLIISKLFKIAQQQQKVIEKLAQMPADPSAQDPNIKYLQDTFQIAALNSGATSITAPKVTATPASSEGNVEFAANYIINATGIPADNMLRQKIINAVKTQVRMQKPELDGKVSVVFV